MKIIHITISINNNFTETQPRSFSHLLSLWGILKANSKAEKLQQRPIGLQGETFYYLSLQEQQVKSLPYQSFEPPSSSQSLHYILVATQLHFSQPLLLPQALELMLPRPNSHPSLSPSFLMVKLTKLYLFKVYNVMFSYTYIT